MTAHDVRGSILRAPWWVLSVLSGVVFGIGQFLTQLGQGVPEVSATVEAVIAGLVFGAVMGPFAARQNRQFLEAQGDVPRGSEREVRRAVMRGPVPPDPQVRAAAARIVALRLGQMRRLRWTAIIWVVFIALGFWLAFTESPLWALYSLLVAGGLLAYQLWLPGRLRQRGRLLEDDQEPAREARDGT